jgi:hypothetical protein
MIGRFVTTQYDDRAAFERREPSGVHVCYNRFTLAGMEWMWQMMFGQLRSSDGTLTDHLGNARIVVGNGDQEVSFQDSRLSGQETAQADLDAGFPTIQRVGTEDPDIPDAVEAVFRATFGEDVAAFDWQERGVVTAQGVLIDRAVRDQGRKVLGAIWQLEARLRLVGR